MGWVNWLWGGDETETDPNPDCVVLRDSWFGGIRLEKISQEQAKAEREQRWWKLWNWE